MPDMDDYFAFKMTSEDSGSGGGGGGGSNGGRPAGCLTWAVVIFVFLYILGRLAA